LGGGGERRNPKERRPLFFATVEDDEVDEVEVDEDEDEEVEEEEAETAAAA